ncbi:Ribonuclease H protein [Melia azedarach]|uniref:Ribonuclease H protein n=1 Tax=Melia azedarach TaxID=155640 RepID=A0ACC1WUS6_MELAZ|nr:Ribonuclease H protein [Melia azedarach]
MNFFIFYVIWKSCNKARWDRVQVQLPSVFSNCNTHSIFCYFVSWLCEVWADRGVLAHLVIPLSYRKAPKVMALFWTPLLVGWVKINTDDLSKGNLGPAACAAVYRDADGHFLGGFRMPLDDNSAFFAELMAVIMVVEQAIYRGWSCVWLECDSSPDAYSMGFCSLENLESLTSLLLSFG